MSLEGDVFSIFKDKRQCVGSHFLKKSFSGKVKKWSGDKKERGGKKRRLKQSVWNMV
jgi:hypothetical protein